MGTSSPYGGHKDHNPLLPHDYGDPSLPLSKDVPPPASEKSDDPKEPQKEEKSSKDDHANQEEAKKDDKASINKKPVCPTKPGMSWRQAKSAFSKHINGRGYSDVRKVVQSYGRASGSVKGLLSSSKAGIAAGNALVQFVTNNIRGTDDISNRIRNIFNSGDEIKIVLSQLANVLSPSPDDKEAAIARDAVTSTMCYLYDYIDKNELDISILQNMDVALQGQTISRYTLEYIWGKMLNDLQSRIEEKSSGPNEAIKIEREFREYIKNVVDVEIRKTQGNGIGSNRIDVKLIFNNCYEVLVDGNK
jgi:hypothetical protein